MTPVSAAAEAAAAQAAADDSRAKLAVLRQAVGGFHCWMTHDHHKTLQQSNRQHFWQWGLLHGKAALVHKLHDHA